MRYKMSRGAREMMADETLSDFDPSDLWASITP